LRRCIRFSAGTQLGGFSCGSGSACFTGHARVALCFQPCLAGDDGFFFGFCIAMGFRAGFGIEPCAFFGERAGACFGAGAVFSGDRCLRFRFHATDRFAYGLEVDAVAGIKVFRSACCVVIRGIVILVLAGIRDP
jgi:hypothetical protein